MTALLRPGTTADAPTVAEIWHSGWLDGHKRFVPEELVALRTATSFLERSIRHVPLTTVAEVDGSIAGFTMIVADEVEQMYVSRGHRGGGIAQQLMDHAETTISAADHSHAWLAVVGGNERARAFYAKQGWHDEGPISYPAEGPEGPISVSAHRYVKDLG